MPSICFAAILKQPLYVLLIPMYLIVATVLLCLVFQNSGADTIRKVIRADGSVEYTNVKSDKKPLAGGSSKKPYEAIYKFRGANGVLTFSDQKPTKGIEFETLKFACYACNPVSTVNWHSTALNLSAFKQEVDRYSEEFSVDSALVRAVIHAESAFKVGAISSQGAQGLMQLMPATAKELGVVNALEPSENIYGGTKYLAELLRLYQGDITKATAAYNAGPGAVKKYEGVPPYAETKAYVKRVAILHKRYQQAEP